MLPITVLIMILSSLILKVVVVSDVLLLFMKRDNRGFVLWLGDAL